MVNISNAMFLDAVNMVKSEIIPSSRVKEIHLKPLSHHLSPMASSSYHYYQS